METSASRSAEKKDKMDGSGFPDLPKKPSETRGSTPIQSGNCVKCGVRECGGGGCGWSGGQVESRSHRRSARRAKG